MYVFAMGAPGFEPGSLRRCVYCGGLAGAASGRPDAGFRRIGLARADRPTRHERGPQCGKAISRATHTATMVPTSAASITKGERSRRPKIAQKAATPPATADATATIDEVASQGLLMSVAPPRWPEATSAMKVPTATRNRSNRRTAVRPRLELGMSGHDPLAVLLAHLVKREVRVDLRQDPREEVGVEVRDDLDDAPVPHLHRPAGTPGHTRHHWSQSRGSRTPGTPCHRRPRRRGAGRRAVPACAPETARTSPRSGPACSEHPEAASASDSCSRSRPGLDAAHSGRPCPSASPMSTRTTVTTVAASGRSDRNTVTARSRPRKTATSPITPPASAHV